MLHEIFLGEHLECAFIEAKAGHKPYQDGCQENDGSRFFDKGGCSLPNAVEYAGKSGNVVSGKLHNEGSRIACEHFGLLEDDTGDYDRRNTDNISAPSDQCAVSEQSACDQTDDGELSSAGDEGCGHDRHSAVSLILNGTGSHDAGNAAAGTDHHRNERLSGQTESSEDTVHNERNSCHIAAALEESQADEQDDHLRQEAEDSADAGNNTIQDQAAEPVCRSDALKKSSDGAGNDLTEQDVVDPVCSHSTDRIDRQKIDYPHDQQEDRDR